MRKAGCVVVAAVLLSGWGFRAHRDINYYAVYALPQPLQAFYKKHHKYIKEEAVKPDILRNTNPQEAPRHFIDLEYYLQTPGFRIGMSWEEVYDLLGDSVYRWGTLPWTIERFYNLLVDAFKNRDVKKILYLSTFLGHYVADAHVPLHTTVNYDGQLTGQRGIHSLWETTIPEYFSSNYSPIVGTANYIPDIRIWVWRVILESHYKVDSVIQMEKRARKLCGKNGKDTIITRGSREYAVPSRQFCLVYDSLMNRLVERRWRKSILNVASVWYSAWVDAGRPEII